MVTASPIRWWEIEVEVPAALAEDAAALAVAGGAQGAELHEAAGELTRLRISYAGELTDEEVCSLARLALAELAIVHGELIARERVDTDWSERWKEYFNPLNLGDRLWVVPSWHEGFTPPTDAVTIEIDPGMAFGTGQHSTTALCAEWLETRFPPQSALSLLDVGCGSGILSVACAKLGASSVTAIDNDEVAVTVARDNATANDVELSVSDTPVDAVSGTFDIVVANILTHTLCELAPHLVARTAPGGWLALSGIFEDQESEIMTAFTKACAAAKRPTFTPTVRQLRDRWLLLGVQL